MWIFLSCWWSARYSKPLKDPLLQSYTLEELTYEYFLHEARDEVAVERKQEAEDKEEFDKIDAGEAWADEMEAEFEREMEQERIAAEKAKQDEWMKKEIEEHNEEFEDNLSIDFEE